MRTRLQRRGVSVLEVLFAIGVIAIGLLGVMAVIPVALDQVGRGNVSDRVARLGQNAEEVFFSRDMFRRPLWVQPLVRQPAQLAQTHWAKPAVFPLVCIDPQFVAANVGQAVLAPNPPSPPNNPANSGPYYSLTLNPDMFPYARDLTALGNASTIYPEFTRVSMQSPRFPPDGASPPNFDILRRPVADQWFLLDDELTFDIPLENALPPTQQFGAGAKRQFDGNYSWFATLAPVVSLAGAISDSHFLSIVVCHKRDQRFQLTNSDECLGTIIETNFHSGGYHGGDVTVTGSLASELEVKAGQWVMLVRYWKSVPWARWFRVVAADVTPEWNGSEWQLDVSLEGPDWPVVNYSSPPPLPPPLPAGTTPTRMIIVRGVAEVFERTVHLE